MPRRSSRKRRRSSKKSPRKKSRSALVPPPRRASGSNKHRTTMKQIRFRAADGKRPRDDGPSGDADPKRRRDDDSPEEEDCPICQEPLRPDSSSIYQTPCKHKFHTDCIVVWAKRCVGKFRCPMCMTNLKIDVKCEETVFPPVMIASQMRDDTEIVPADDSQQVPVRFQFTLPSVIPCDSCSWHGTKDIKKEIFKWIKITPKIRSTGHTIGTRATLHSFLSLPTYPLHPRLAILHLPSLFE